MGGHCLKERQDRIAGQLSGRAIQKKIESVRGPGKFEIHVGSTRTIELPIKPERLQIPGQKVMLPMQKECRGNVLPDMEVGRCIMILFGSLSIWSAEILLQKAPGVVR